MSCPMQVTLSSINGVAEDAFHQFLSRKRGTVVLRNQMNFYQNPVSLRREDIHQEALSSILSHSAKSKCLYMQPGDLFFYLVRDLFRCVHHHFMCKKRCLSGLQLSFVQREKLKLSDTPSKQVVY